MSEQNIFLVGLMAVGKSTVGRQLAEALDRPFFDSDHEIEKRAGAEIAWIFDVEGEVGFRDREEQVIMICHRCRALLWPLVAAQCCVKQTEKTWRLAVQFFI